MSPTREEMKARLSQNVEGWKPQPGDEVIGVITAIDELDGGYGPYPYLEVDDEDAGKVVGVHAFHSVLKRELSSKTPKVGDSIAIGYIGKGKTKAGTDFDNYNVNVYPADKSDEKVPNWDALGQDATDELKTAFPGATEEDAF